MIDRAVLKRVYCKGFTDDEAELFVATCEKTGLSPEARQIYAMSRWDSKQRKEVMSIQTSVDGFRVVADRTGKYQGQLGPFWCGKDGVWSDVWLQDGYPFAAKIGCLRTDFKEPIWSVAKWDSYVQTTKEGKVSSMWAKMPDLMLAKCAEALALRKAFPQELSGLYTTDEMTTPSQHEEKENNERSSRKNIPEEKKIDESQKRKIDNLINQVVTFFSGYGITEKDLEEFIGVPLAEMNETHFKFIKSAKDKILAGEDPHAALGLKRL